MTDRPALSQFRADCRAWLESSAISAIGAGAGRAREWGQGSDSVALFHNLTPAEELALVEESRRWYQRRAAAGFGSITWEAEYGGQDLPTVYERAYRSEEARFVTPPSHEVIAISTNLIAATVRVHGTPSQRHAFVRALRSTELVGCQLFSEPAAGSDLASVATRAERRGENWVLTGQKVWTTGAQFADYGLALCRTDSTGDRRAGITAFLVPMASPGVVVRPLRQMSGGASFNEVFLDGVEVSDSLRLGEVGAGWTVARTTLGFERGSTATAPRIGASWNQVLELARHMGATTDPRVRADLVALYCSVQALRWSAKRSAAQARAGRSPGPEGSVAKLAWTNQLQLISDVVSRLLGPRLGADTGEWGTFAWADHVCGAPGYRIAGGTDEVQRTIIGERILGLPSEPAGRS